MKGLPRWIWIGLAVLGEALALTIFSRADPDRDPSPSNTGPYGTSLLFALLKDRGYEATTFDRLPRNADGLMEPNPDDVVVAMINWGSPAGQRLAATGSGFDAFENSFVEGSRLFCLTSSREVAWDNPAMRRKMRVRFLYTPSTRDEYVSTLDPESGRDENHNGGLAVASFFDDGEAIGGAEVSFTNGGAMLRADIGDTPLNFNIAEEQNAAVFFHLLRTVGPHAKRVVLYWPSDETDKTDIIGLLGPWALAAWYQFWLLGAVIVWTLGKPFGLPEEPSARQQGSREFIQSIAGLLNRRRLNQYSTRRVTRQLERKLAANLHLASESKTELLVATAPERVAVLLRRMHEAAADPAIREQDARCMLSDLERAIDSLATGRFEAKNGRGGARTKRSHKSV